MLPCCLPVHPPSRLARPAGAGAGAVAIVVVVVVLVVANARGVAAAAKARAEGVVARAEGGVVAAAVDCHPAPKSCWYDAHVCSRGGFLRAGTRRVQARRLVTRGRGRGGRGQTAASNMRGADEVGSVRMRILP